MATDLVLNKNETKCLDPGCNSAAYCCWYETTKEFSNICTNRNALVCQLRREEVFGGEEAERMAQK
ncbi:MAG: hypothetical protein LBO66_07155 [Deltaproteobacteria bacterium]|jgi:hypothetical protein|nr:hypothetical protein [Deltaproteobacteria bacterium]